jgi:endonuclease G, mitochondrial
MNMASYLTFDQTRELIDAAIGSDLIFARRQLLLRDIRRSFAAALPMDPSPLDQFKLDLTKLNSVERLEDGTVPLVLYLRNAADQIRDLPEAKVFLKYQNGIQNRTAGLRNLAPLTTLPATVIQKQAIINRDDTLDKAFLEGCLRSAESVVKLMTPRFDNRQQKFIGGMPWIFNGTGWLLTDELVITNHHVINSRNDDEGNAPTDDFAAQANQTVALFDFDTDTSDPRKEKMDLVMANEALDYCILRLKSKSTRTPLPVCNQLVEIDTTTYLPVNILQHPYGRPKRFALRNNLAVDADKELLRYYTDTDYGSSGAPVLDDHWRVVALHRGAMLRDGKFQGRDTAFVNVGTQIVRILEDIKNADPKLYGELKI